MWIVVTIAAPTVVRSRLRCINKHCTLQATVMTNLLTGCSSLRLGPIEYPVYACYIGWSLIMLGALQVPLWAVVSALKNPSVSDGTRAPFGISVC